MRSVSVLSLGLALVLSALAFASAPGGGKAPPEPGKTPSQAQVLLDTGPTPVSLSSAIRALAQGAGYTAVVGEIPEVRVVLRSLRLPLQEALELLVSTYLGKDYGYLLQPEKRVVVVGKRESLEAILKRAGAVAPPEEEAKKGQTSKEGEGTGEVLLLQLPEGYEEGELKEALKAVAGESKLVFLKAGDRLLVSATGKGEDLKRLEGLVAQLRASAPPPSKTQAPPRLQLKVAQLAEPLDPFLRELLQTQFGVKLYSLPGRLLCWEEALPRGGVRGGFRAGPGAPTSGGGEGEGEGETFPLLSGPVDRSHLREPRRGGAGLGEGLRQGPRGRGRVVLPRPWE